MTLKDRAARALDLTHRTQAHQIGIHAKATRNYVAAWLDGIPKKRKNIIQAVRYLEMIAGL